MTKKDNKIFWSIVVFSFTLLLFGLIGRRKIEQNPVYIYGKIVSVSIASKTLLGYEFVYENKTYYGGINTNGANYKKGDFFMVKFQKSNPNNSRPIFDKDSWRCLLKDSSYYYGSPKKPDCEY
jgi:hypothetical protein